MKLQLLGNPNEVGKREWKRRLSLARKHLRETNALYGIGMTEVPVELWPECESKPDRVWRSSQFLVQGFAEDNPYVRMRLSVCRTDIDDTGEWRADIGWEELQGIKDGCGFWEYDAVEIYPTTKDVVNVANLRHIWVLEYPVHFAWRKKE